MTGSRSANDAPLSARAQSILERVEREALEAAVSPRPADPGQGLGRPRPAAEPASGAAPDASAEGATVDHLLALVNALAQRTEAARRQLEELTVALDLLTRDLAAPAASPPAAGDTRNAPPQPPRRPGDPAAPPAVRWPSGLR